MQWPVPLCSQPAKKSPFLSVSMLRSMFLIKILQYNKMFNQTAHNRDEKKNKIDDHRWRTVRWVFCLVKHWINFVWSWVSRRDWKVCTSLYLEVVEDHKSVAVRRWKDDLPGMHGECIGGALMTVFPCADSIDSIHYLSARKEESKEQIESVCVQCTLHSDCSIHRPSPSTWRKLRYTRPNRFSVISCARFSFNSRS